MLNYIIKDLFFFYVVKDVGFFFIVMGRRVLDVIVLRFCFDKDMVFIGIYLI